MISIPKLLIVAVIIALIFGTSKLKNIGSDLGEALKNFKKAVKDDKPTTTDDNLKLDNKEQDTNESEKQAGQSNEPENKE